MALEGDPIKAAGDSVAKIAGDVYIDIARPAAQRVGTALETLFKVGLSPIAMLDWGFEKSKTWLTLKVTSRLDQIPPECRITPPNSITVPALIGIATNADAPELREIFAELLLKAMDSRTRGLVHPSYLLLLSQLCPEEALVFISFYGKNPDGHFSDTLRQGSLLCLPTIEEQFDTYCAEVGLVDTRSSDIWLENFQRLGLVSLERISEAKYVEPDARRSAAVDTIEHRYFFITVFGRAFLEACAPRSQP